MTRLLIERGPVQIVTGLHSENINLLKEKPSVKQIYVYNEISLFANCGAY